MHRVRSGQGRHQRPSLPDQERPARTVHANLTLVLEVTFVRNDDDRERVLVLHPEDLLVERADFLERVPRRN